MRVVFALLLLLVSCRAPDVMEATPPHRSALNVLYRVLPPPPGCAPVRAPVVFLPALGFTGHAFAAVAERMEACRSRVLVTLPGVEDRLAGVVASERVVEAVADVVDAESDAPVILVGHSLGGAVATRLAAEHPALVSTLVLVNAAVVPFDLSWWERLALRPKLWAPALRIFGQPALLRRLLPDEIGGTIDEFDLRKLAHLLAEPQRRVTLLAYYRAFLTPSELLRTQKALGQVRAPVLVLWGRRDGVLPPSVVAAIRAAIAPTVRVEVRYYAQGAHLLPMERPEDVARALDDLDAALPRGRKSVSAKASTDILRGALGAGGSSTPAWRAPQWRGPAARDP